MELTSVQIGILMIALAVGLMLIGFPVAVTMIIAGFLGMWLIRGGIAARAYLVGKPGDRVF